MKPKFFIGPMSKNIVDTIIDFCNHNDISIGLIPSRRQVEFNGGYVNNWNTSEFVNYVRNKTNKVMLVRDHSGPGQGQSDDDGYDSLKEDCKFFDVIHIDPWKKYQSFEDGLNETINMINFCYSLNPDIEYEVGTEEAIRRFETHEINELVERLKLRLNPLVYSKIKYLVIQSGTSLKGTNQTGEYDKDRLISMVELSRKHNLISKEHNGDYLPEELIKEKFKYGLDSINIAPEFGVIETKVILESINESNFQKFFEICLNSKKWVKWVDNSFKPEERKKELIQICGHYVFSTEEFINLKNKINLDIDKLIKNKIKGKLNKLCCMTKIDYVEVLNNYFDYFSKKDINNLKELFSKDVELIDWEINSKGINDVIESNKNIFNSVDTIKVKLMNIYENSSDKSFCCEILITVNEDTYLKVIDIIRFDEQGKIRQVSAYKQ